MNRSQRILPVYTGDVSGACSALFELGGMVVIHDPSGCNSTYNTHDETRWYDYDSLIFISGLVERDAILGNDDKFVRDVVDAALELRPRFVALCNSPIPFITGTDFAALCKMIQARTGIPCFYVPTNGMHDYTVGAGGALAEVAERFVRPAAVRAGTLNVLGVTPLDFAEADVRGLPNEARAAAAPGARDAVGGATGASGAAATGNATGATGELRAFVQDAGFELVSCWAMGSTLDELARAAEAEVNLVVSSVGIPAAEVLRRRFGTPYVVGRPQGLFAASLAEALRSVAAGSGSRLMPCKDARMSSGDATRVVVGEPVAAGSLAASLELADGEPTRVVCATESAFGLLAPHDVYADGEEEVEAALVESRIVYADAFYAPVCPPSARLVCVPHFAFSGRQAWLQ
ncbi:MAG: hypothetical protein IKG21_06220 [Atopobiaceae bacterium]|nr:hypothetical protein [Atopobiaceae bacterium]